MSKRYSTAARGAKKKDCLAYRAATNRTTATQSQRESPFCPAIGRARTAYNPPRVKGVCDRCGGQLY
ncbi:MAG: hypothetical protein ACK2U9_22055, partial [Anaerolineae bacterium]